MDEAFLATLDQVRLKLERGRRVSVALPGGGRLMLDRPLPFICVQRVENGVPDPGVDGLVRSLSCHLTMPAGPEHAERTKAVLGTVIAAVNATSRSFLIIELWATTGDTFTAMCPADNLPSTSGVLREGLRELASSLPGAKAALMDTDVRHPPNAGELFSKEELRKLGALTIGIAIPPVYRTPDGRFSQLGHRVLRSRFTDVIKRTVFDFIRVQTPLRFPHHLTLGRTSITRASMHIDRRLVRIAASFDLLLHVTPVNTQQAWAEFSRQRFERAPEFSYRLVPVDPDLMKRQLFNLRINEVEDTTLEFMFREKRNELETQLTLLSERGTPRFIYSSLRLFGDVDKALLRKARSLVRTLDPLPQGAQERMGATEFATLARAELKRYGDRFAIHKPGVQVRNDVDGILVSRGQLLISEVFSVERRRAAALLQHEVGTHMLTYCNGLAQPLQLLAMGLAGHDTLQEGLAVVAEHLMDGLSAPRLKLLASRVLAVDAMLRGATFVDCFRMLHNDAGHAPEEAFAIATRVYRGGGFAKDAAYLRGLLQLLDHLGQHPDHLDLLFTGKFNLRHIRLMEGLQHRGVLAEPVLPPYVNPATRDRLRTWKNGMPLARLVNT